MKVLFLVSLMLSTSILFTSCNRSMQKSVSKPLSAREIVRCTKKYHNFHHAYNLRDTVFESVDTNYIKNFYHLTYRDLVDFHENIIDKKLFGKTLELIYSEYRMDSINCNYIVGENLVKYFNNNLKNGPNNMFNYEFLGYTRIDGKLNAVFHYKLKNPKDSAKIAEEIKYLTYRVYNVVNDDTHEEAYLPDFSYLSLDTLDLDNKIIHVQLEHDFENSSIKHHDSITSKIYTSKIEIIAVNGVEVGPHNDPNIPIPYRLYFRVNGDDDDYVKAFDRLKTSECGISITDREIYMSTKMKSHFTKEQYEVILFMMLLN